MNNKKPAAADKDRARRMQWWHEARFGMFVHWGLYSQPGRSEWTMQRERIPLEKYEALADTWKPKRGAARNWVRIAKKAGAKYVVLTTKHHEGFSLWDSKVNPYNAARRGPGRDLVREFVEACRAEGMRVGLYYSLMDWHHPDGWRAGADEAARRRFVDYTHGLVRELMTNYGKIDILWYDVARPMMTPEGWESARLNKAVRKLQPDILINNRSHLPEDFGTPEEHIAAPEAGRAWEACMTLSGSWGWFPFAPDEDWQTPREIIEMLGSVTTGAGNLLLNVGPDPAGDLAENDLKSLLPVGQWLAKNGEAAYGAVKRFDRAAGCRPPLLSYMSCKGRNVYVWLPHWRGPDWVIAGFTTKLKRASFLASGRAIRFQQNPKRILLSGMPGKNPDPIAGVSVVKLEFAAEPAMDMTLEYVPAPR